MCGWPTDERRAIAGWRVLLLQWQPSSSQLEWLLCLLWQWRRHNRRIVCGQIPRPLPLVWHTEGREWSNKEGRLAHIRTRNRLFSSTTKKRTKVGRQSVKAGGSVSCCPLSSSSSFAAPSLSRSCSCGINKGGGTGGRFGGCSSVGWIKSPQMVH